MKKIWILLCAVLAFTALCLVITNKSGTILYLLNWGEYISSDGGDEDLLAKFEKENDCKVVMEEVSSSEQMYSKINLGATPYDVAIPGDYVIERLAEEDKLYEIDKTKLTNYSDGIFVDSLQKLIDEDAKDYNDYFMPYFWGVYTAVYRTNAGVDFQNIIENNGFKAFFDRSLYSKNVNIGMYNVARWAVTCYLLANNIDINTTDFKTNNLGKTITQSLKNASYYLWGDDILKKDVADGNLDLIFVQLGDFFDQYYAQEADGLDVNFSTTIPNNTAAFFDGMVIPKTSKNYDLAIKFIDFMLNKENSFINATYVGYCPTLKSVGDMYKNDSSYDEFLAQFPFYLDPLSGKNAHLFKNLGTEYQTEVESIVNKAKI